MTINITNAEASANILRFADEGRLTQCNWHGKAKDGREIACLLGSIHPSVTSPEECNGALMPLWLADLTPTLFDGIPAKDIVPIARRYGALVARWDALSPEAWGRVLTRFLVCTVDEAEAGARLECEGRPYWPEVEAVFTRVKSALVSGDKNELAAAAEAAWAAPMRVAAAWTASAAARAARATAEAWRVSAAAVAAAGASWAAAAAYADLFTFLLDRIEAECDAARHRGE